eukprot:PhF_6_TR8896/c0_g1_i2/m.14062
MTTSSCAGSTCTILTNSPMVARPMLSNQTRSGTPTSKAPSQSQRKPSRGRRRLGLLAGLGFHRTTGSPLPVRRSYVQYLQSWTLGTKGTYCTVTSVLPSNETTWSSPTAPWVNCSTVPTPTVTVTFPTRNGCDLRLTIQI